MHRSSRVFCLPYSRLFRIGFIRSWGIPLIVIAGAAASNGAPTWQPNIADSYQHQRWGAPAGSGVAGAADAAPALVNWQANYAAGPPEKGNFGGWCFYAAIDDVLYRYSTLNYATYGANNVNSVTKLHDEIATLRTDYLAAAGSGVTRLANVLNTRGAGTSKGVTVPGKQGGLVSGEFTQSGADVKYISSDGRERAIKTTTIFDQIPDLMQLGDSSVLRVFPKAGGASSPLNWWNFHAVAVAGYDTAGNGTAYFADPDSNKGNADAQAGWTAFFGTGLADWKAAPAGVPAKARRFNEGADGIPVPAGAVPTAAEQASLYFTGTLDATKTKFSTTDRYNGVEIRQLHTFEHMRGANKGAGGAAGGAAKTFQVTPDATTSVGLSEFYLFPKPGEDISAVSPISGWSSSLYTGADPLDPLTTDRVGWHFTANGLANAISGGSVLEFDYSTLIPSASPLDSWDLVYNSFTRDPITGAALSPVNNFNVQVVNPASGYDPVFDQVGVPEPGTLSMLLLGVVIAAYRGRRTR